MLYRGPQMDYFQAAFDVTHYVKLEWAEVVVDLIMGRYDQFNLNHIKRGLREKAKNKYNSILIDGAFVLRIILEFYRIERKNRYKLLKEVFLAQSTLGFEQQISVTFRAFKNICELNYPAATDLDVAELYRECYNIGQGCVNIDSFYTIASDTNFFTSQLKIKSLFHDSNSH